MKLRILLVQLVMFFAKCLQSRKKEFRTIRKDGKYHLYMYDYEKDRYVWISAFDDQKTLAKFIASYRSINPSNVAEFNS
ncbi:hypothetical protein V6R21_19845 [Limibacter armeniacum]|uniref:hypothetical protein n=1 Tax=Limibacter armeniacum TaxID=466084 RepID=UPI002FE572E3